MLRIDNLEAIIETVEGKKTARIVKWYKFKDTPEACLTLLYISKRDGVYKLDGSLHKLNDNAIDWVAFGTLLAMCDKELRKSDEAVNSK